jgi:hypothetical protein
MLRSYTTAFRHFVNQLCLPWRKTQRENFIRLGGAFLVRRHVALRRLARTLAGPTPRAKAADKRLRRFLGNDRLHLDEALRAYLRFLLPRLARTAYVPVMLDWTYLGERAILALAIPYHGRSLPLFATVHERRIEKRVYSQTQAEIALLRRVRWCWPSDAPPPLLLVDRGFDKSRLLEWLLHGTTGKKQAERAPSAPGSHPWSFVLRSCMQAAVTDRHGRRLTKRLLVYPGETLLYPHVTYHLEGQFAARLVITCVRDPKTKKPATWYLLTNLPEAALGQAPAWYAERMEPEETYRDWKDGFLLAGFGLRGLKRLRRDRLERYLFLLGLIYGFLVLLAETERENRAWFQRRKGWGVSLITFALDLLTHLGAGIRSLARQACASVRLEPLWPQSGDY